MEQDNLIIFLPSNNGNALPVYYWLLDIGSFLDRFGQFKLAILANTDPILQAYIKDIQCRDWVDLQNPDIPPVLAYIAGENVPGIGQLSIPVVGFTPDMIPAIMTTPPTQYEQFATVKKFFS